MTIRRFLPLVTLLFADVFIVFALPASDEEFRHFSPGLPTEGETAAVAITVDEYGNTYVVGNTHGTLGTPDIRNLSSRSIFVAKYSRSGILIWLRRTGSAKEDKATAIGHYGKTLYVTGTTRGNVSEEAEPNEISKGNRDGFVLAYDSFTGKRRWSTQFGSPSRTTEINAINISRQAGVVIAGWTNQGPFAEDGKMSTQVTFFVARLGHASGRERKRFEHRISSASNQALSCKLLIDEDAGLISLLFADGKRRRQNELSYLSLVLETLLLVEERKVLAHAWSKNDNAIRLAKDAETNDVLLVYSSKTEAGSESFGLYTVTQKPDINGYATSHDFFPGGTETPEGVVVNTAGYAFVLGSVSKSGAQRDAVPGLWVYDVRQRRTVTNYLGNAQGEYCSHITDFVLDSNGNIPFAGLRMTPSGKEEFVLGTFGVPSFLKSRTRREESDVKPLVLESTGSGNPSGDTGKGSSGRGTHAKRSFWTTETGKPTTASIAFICLGGALLLLLAALVYSFMVRRKREERVIRLVEQEERSRNDFDEAIQR